MLFRKQWGEGMVSGVCGETVEFGQNGGGDVVVHAWEFNQFMLEANYLVTMFPGGPGEQFELQHPAQQERGFPNGVTIGEGRRRRSAMLRPLGPIGDLEPNSETVEAKGAHHVLQAGKRCHTG